MWRVIFVGLFQTGELLRVACRAIRSNGYRSVLTIGMLVVGVSALVGMMTATQALRVSLSGKYAHLGTHSFYFYAAQDQPSISSGEVRLFSQVFDFPGIVSGYSRIGTVAFSCGGRSTAPNVDFYSVDEHFLDLYCLGLERGRNFTSEEVRSNAPFALVGVTVAKQLFGEDAALGKWIVYGRYRYCVVGVLAASAGGLDLDRSVLVASRVLQGVSYEIGFSPDLSGLNGKETDPEDCLESARLQFRQIRHLTPLQVDNFTIRQHDRMLADLQASLRTISHVSWWIAGLALLGAAVGFMNMMLVAVRDRTPEIGLRRALGATAAQIRTQFLMEALLMGGLGGAGGLILGLVMGWILSRWFVCPFVLPGLWLPGSFFLCCSVALLSGYLPSSRAALLMPNEALHCE